MLYYLAGGDITKYNTILSTNANLAFGLLALEKSDKKLLEWAKR